MSISRTKNPFIIILDRISKNGNLGTIIRSDDALGCDGIIVTGRSVDIYDPNVISSTTGSFFSSNIEKIDTSNGILQRLREIKNEYPEIQIVGATEKGKKRIRDYNFDKPVVLVIGNEKDGLSKFYLENCDEKIQIPIVGDATSLNIACATSIFLYEIFSQRNKK